MATKAKGKQKPVCKYGAKCYRKNEQHLKQYAHPDDDETNEKEEDEPPKKKPKTGKRDESKAENSPKGKVNTIQQYFGQRNKEKTSTETQDRAASSSKEVVKATDEATVTAGTEQDASDVEDDVEPPPSPSDVRQNIKLKFLVDMPEDFYDFWNLCKNLNPEDPLEALQDSLNLTLVGPFDILAGRHKDVEVNSSGRRPNYLLHWRYYYDPPEFLTVIKGDDSQQFHLGYFRDDPKEMPVFVAVNCAKKNGTITPRGDNLFSAVNFYLSEKLKEKGLSSEKKTSLQRLEESVKKAASSGGYSLDQKTKAMKERDKKVVSKTFHEAGLVVPLDENEVGYRPLPETPADLKRMLKKIQDSKTEEERNKNMDPLQEIVTFVQFANDECDYGEGIELGLDLFTYGGQCFHSLIRSLLTLGYQLVGRPEYSKIIDSHLKKRSHLATLSQID